MGAEDVDSDGHVDLFKEPDDYYPPDKEATYTEYQLLNGNALKLRLIGHSPLWGHLLWNAGRVVAGFLEDNPQRYIKDKSVLELGAGAGLPSLVCAVHGARNVVVTDYPDPDLVENLHYNIKHCGVIPASASIVAEGYLWGQSAEPLKRHLGRVDASFDLVILADILFNHSEHEKLVDSVKMTLSKAADARALVFFTPYRPWLLEKDLRFFDLAREGGFRVEKILEEVMDKAMFENDPGDELLRRTVYGYELAWNSIT